MTEERTEYKTKHGGPRPGSGPHPKAGKGGPKRKTISLRFSPEFVRWYNEFKGDRTEAIEIAVKEKYGF